jgi:hypothetical protein
VSATVPATWHVVEGNPAFCGSIVGRTAYFYVGPDGPAPGCSSSAPTGPYFSVECLPHGAAALTSQATKVGPFVAIVQQEPGETLIYLIGRDTLLDLYGTSGLLRRIEPSISATAGSC